VLLTHEFGTAYNFGFRWLYDPDTNNLSLSTGEHTTVTELLTIDYAAKIFDFKSHAITTTGNVSAATFNSGTLSGNNSGDQTSSDFTHNDLSGLNDGTSYEHITQTEKNKLWYCIYTFPNSNRQSSCNRHHRFNDLRTR